MPTLYLSFLGPFQVRLDDTPLTAFGSNKVRALLVLLSVEAMWPHARERLAGMLWPSHSERAAHVCLRSALANLRHVIGDHAADPPYLLVTRHTLQFNPASRSVRDFAGLQALQDQSIEQMETLAAAYHGEFVEGFSLPDSPPFEEWLRQQREQFARQFIEMLRALGTYHQWGGDYERSIVYTRRQLQLEPWDEEAHRRLMRLLFLSDRRSLALAQYETCCRLLREELGIAPEHETTELYERIRTETL
jgi:DNA-binding SARP family transcriptional activator